MLWVTTRASSMESLFKIPPVVTNDPWFLATLVDAYSGFLTFYAWIFYKHRSPATRVIWFVVLMLTGNIGVASYMLWMLFKLPDNATGKDILLRSDDLQKA